jgi:NADPH-dependent curcumin reductase CurA
MRGEWRDSTYAEYTKLPLETLQLLDEKRFLGSQAEGGLGYTIEDLVYLTRFVVPYGGLRDIDVKPGETVIVAPAAGSFGGAAVRMALAMVHASLPWAATKRLSFVYPPAASALRSFP